jgi:hypothetical protein
MKSKRKTDKLNLQIFQEILGRSWGKGEVEEGTIAFLQSMRRKHCTIETSILPCKKEENVEKMNRMVPSL